VLVSQEILSTVVQPTVDEGREAVRILLELLDHPERAPIQLCLPTWMALRRSCGCGGDRAVSAPAHLIGGATT
jgi:DNA-binding LacI/PurR family transcriptional regulator